MSAPIYSTGSVAWALVCTKATVHTQGPDCAYAW